MNESNKEEKMPDVTPVSIETTPNTELPIGEVARLTGYAPYTLRRLEKKGVIPKSHQRLHGHGVRYWFADDVPKITEYQLRMDEERVARAAGLNKKGVQARKEG